MFEEVGWPLLDCDRHGRCDDRCHSQIRPDDGQQSRSRGQLFPFISDRAQGVRKCRNGTEPLGREGFVDPKAGRDVYGNFLYLEH
jgi:hypothetical protein